MPQSLSNILLHIVFSTKDRRPLIRPEIEDELYPYLATVAAAVGCPALAVNGTADHVHMCCALGRTTAPADLLEEVKKRSSKWIKTKERTYTHFNWQNGYGAFSIGQSQLPALKQYVALQKEHHRKRSFQDEYRELLRKYGVAFDQRYVWD